MKFRVKLTLWMLGVLSLLFGIGGSLLISVSFQTALQREQDVAYHSYKMALSTLQIVNDPEKPLNYDSIAHILDQLCQQNTASWTALQLTDGNETIFEFGSSKALLHSLSAQPEPGTCQFQYDAEPDNGRYLLLCGAIDAGSSVLYLNSVHDISFVYETRRTQLTTFQWVFAAMALLCAGLSYTVSRVLTKPLEALSRTSRTIASGHFSSRVRLRSNDEVGAVSADFNAMADRLEGTIAQLQDAVQRQENFMGSFAHELKTPMTSIIGYADLLRGQTLTAEEQAEAADYILSEGKRLEVLSRKLLNLLVLKKSDLPLSPVSLSQLLETLVEQIRPVYLSRGIRLSYECQDGLCYLEPDLIRSLLLNLLDNARKAMDDGGFIFLSATMTSQGCRIRVCDNGRGIPPQALAHLTQAFYRVDKSRSRQQGGVGLGLTLCQEIASLHAGELHFESQPGKGTCVSVELNGGRP